jgi:hypothetical protein
MPKRRGAVGSVTTSSVACVANALPQQPPDASYLGDVADIASYTPQSGMAFQTL